MSVANKDTEMDNRVKVHEAADILPNQTIYCRNIETKVKRYPLLDNLMDFFIPYGEIIDIITMRGDKNRGQAFVVYEDITSATAALRSLQGRLFFGKPIQLAYAKTKSDAIKRLEGTYKYKHHTKKIKSLPTAEQAVDEVMENFESDEVTNLYVTNFPTEITANALSVLFGQYPGYLSAEIIQEKGIGIIRFSNSVQAEISMQGLQGFKVTPKHAIQIKAEKGAFS